MPLLEVTRAETDRSRSYGAEDQVPVRLAGSPRIPMLIQRIYLVVVETEPRYRLKGSFCAGLES